MKNTVYSQKQYVLTEKNVYQSGHGTKTDGKYWVKTWNANKRKDNIKPRNLTYLN